MSCDFCGFCWRMEHMVCGIGDDEFEFLCECRLVVVILLKSNNITTQKLENLL